MNIHHIGYLCRNLKDAAKQLRNFGFIEQSEPCYDQHRDVDIQFLRSDNYLVELVAPRSEKSVVWKQLKRTGAAPYHFCFKIENLEEYCGSLTEEYILISAPSPAPALGGKRVAFLYSENMGIVELLESAPTEI